VLFLSNTKHYPLTIDRVIEIKKLNKQGIAVEELEAVEITSKNKEVEPEFVELVGQISLRSLEKNDRRRRDQQRNSPQQRNDQRPDNRNNRPNNGPNNKPNNGPRPNNGPNTRPNNGPRPNTGPRPTNGPSNRPSNGPTNPSAN